MHFQRIAIVGCGLVGGSLALGLKKNGFSGEIVGCDRAEVLEKARRRGAIDIGAAELSEAVANADLIYLATPVVAILDLLPQVAKAARPGALVTDSGSTKVRICRLAKEMLPENVTFLGGHPMAGREVSGIENADADLFAAAKYILVGEPNDEFGELVKMLGAEPVFMDAETHDWASRWSRICHSFSPPPWPAQRGTRPTKTVCRFRSPAPASAT
jgi:prephenate dehydrogenase